ncbi:WD40-repeat-containing domain protein [Cantharellus anzutake]|uniref:WD40-repeat-containing domain protein n=1 Tax=Cantharellus anzutake TaxID=1750568 RepID=UPI001903B0F0|nr:WD40-repeat-containing domain protein [Cantharellus anzutake]KAF8344079.1 WD40-repeat-containing domain protein [Cantharellus anzutake]
MDSSSRDIDLMATASGTQTRSLSAGEGHNQDSSKDLLPGWKQIRGRVSMGSSSSLRFQKAPYDADSRRKSLKRKMRGEASEEIKDPTLLSIARNARPPEEAASAKGKAYRRIPNAKLRAHLNSLHEKATQSRQLRQDFNDLLMVGAEAGGIEVEGEMERTADIIQDDILQSVGIEAATQRKEWALDGGPHMAIGGDMDISLRLIGEYLHTHEYLAVAQSRLTYIYDHTGTEIHRMKELADVHRLEYLPYHWLLVSVSNKGIVRWTDTTTGACVASHRTKLGACKVMAQNAHNAVVYLGHQNGTVTLRTPNLHAPAVTLLAHHGPVSALSVNPSQGSEGHEGKVKIWDCRNWKGCVREWWMRGGVPGAGIELEWSQKGFLGVGVGRGVKIYRDPTKESLGTPELYLRHQVHHHPLTSIRFCPYTDVLSIGEPQFDSREADPFENKKARREREVHMLLDKIPADLITVSDEYVGTVVPHKSNFDPSEYEGRVVPTDSEDEPDFDPESGYQEDGAQAPMRRKRGLIKHKRKKTRKDETRTALLRERLRAQQVSRPAEPQKETGPKGLPGMEAPRTGALARFAR